MIIERRKFITGLVALVAAPAIVKVSSLMPVKVMLPTHRQFIVTAQVGNTLKLDEFVERFVATAQILKRELIMISYGKLKVGDIVTMGDIYKP